MGYQNNPSRPIFTDSDHITCKAVGAITGSTFVAVVAGGRSQEYNVSTATGAAGEAVYGIAGWDVADGQKLTVHRRGVWTATAGAAVTPGPVQVDATGRVVPATTGAVVGIAGADAATGEAVEVTITL